MKKRSWHVEYSEKHFDFEFICNYLDRDQAKYWGFNWSSWRKAWKTSNLKKVERCEKLLTENAKKELYRKQSELIDSELTARKRELQFNEPVSADCLIFRVRDFYNNDCRYFRGPTAIKFRTELMAHLLEFEFKYSRPFGYELAVKISNEPARCLCWAQVRANGHKSIQAVRDSGLFNGDPVSWFPNITLDKARDNFELFYIMGHDTYEWVQKLGALSGFATGD